jgi:GDPmannose 4,6-dehydratase
MVKRALITGITGQDGSYLCEHLLRLGYEVHGTMRRTSTPPARISQIENWADIHVHQATLECGESLSRVVREVRPHECYHLAAQSDVKNSFQDEFSTLKINIGGTHSLLAAIAEHAPDCRFYFAGSSEMFGGLGFETQSEATPFRPRSPYAVSKIAGFHLTQHYRESKGLFTCGGILFNHESPRRGVDFVTRKIAKAAAAISRGKQQTLLLGALNPERDWGYAPEYVAAMHQMLNHHEPGDYVIATNETHSVSEFVEAAFAAAGLDWKRHVQYSPDLLRPCEVLRLKGDYSKAKAALGWEPKTKFAELVRLMVDAEMASVDNL